MDRVYTLRTPENVEFDFVLAGAFSRFLAWMIDLIVIMGLAIAALIVVSLLAPIAGNLAMAVFFVVWFAIRWGYFVFFEWRWRGQSIGKRVMQLRVIQDRGVSITPFQSIIRNLLRLIDGLPLFYFVGGMTAFFHPGNKRLGDIVAGTIVVHIQHRAVPETVIPKKERYNSFITDKKIVSLMDRRITVEERELLTNVALRRDALPLDMRLEFFEMLSRYFQGKLSLKKPEIFSDERFILNITAILLDSRTHDKKQKAAFT